MEKILLVEGSKSFAALLGTRIETELHCKVYWTASLAATQEIMQQEGSEFFLGILGLYLSDAPNGEIVDYILSLAIPCVICTGEMKEDVRSKVINKQVLDYFVKDNPSTIDSILYLIDRLRKNTHLTAMVVDDSASSRIRIRQFLTHYNFSVLEAPDGHQALRLLQEHPNVQVIIVDYEMPGMNGFQLVKKIRTRFSRDRVAVIGLSSHGSGEIASRFLKAGANDFLAKPFRDEELFCRVSQNIEIIEKNIHFENLLAERTQRLQQAHEQLKNREKRLAAILESALDAIITANQAGEVTGFNPAAEKLFGYRAQQAIGRTVTELIIPPTAKENPFAELQGSQHSQVAPPLQVRRRIETPAMRADGSIIDMEMALTSDVLDGELTFTAFLHDITDRKQLLKSLEETLQVAESSNLAKSEFLANMSHEIRSPMNAIIGMTDLVLSTELTNEQKEHLLIVQNASQNLLELINSILDLSKIEAGQFNLEQIPFDVHGRIGKACETLAIRAYQKRIGLYCQIAPEVPETLVGDPMRLTQVLINLINNAIKFTERGEVLLKVTRTTPVSRPKDVPKDAIELCFAVSDTGIGIPEDRLEQIFDRFTQVDGSTTRKYGGTGLGLTICKSIVQMMGGHIAVQSKLGEGSRFYFTTFFTPGNRALPRPDMVMEARRLTEQPSTPLAGMRVVAASVHATGQTILRELLLQAGATVELVADLPALQPLLHQAATIGPPFDLLMVDYRLLGATNQLFAGLTQREGWKNNPVIMAPPSKSVEERSSPFTDPVFLMEPVLKFPLLRAINRALGRPTPQPTLPPRKMAAHRIRPMRLLVVDDLVNNQKLAMNILERFGHTVVVADHGVHAWEILQTSVFDLVLMDLQMPEMDGFATTEKMRHPDHAHLPNARVPIIACTAHALESDRLRCMAAGMNGFLRKPYRPEELLEALVPFAPKPPETVLKQTPTGSAALLKPVEGDPVEIRNRRQQFLDAAPGHLSSLQQTLDAQEWHDAMDHLEWFKTSTDQIGAFRVKWQAMRLRSQVELKDMSQISSLIQTMKEECDKIRTTLEAESQPSAQAPPNP
ncbi:MAG: response regulator [Magnetococcus sp. YQC-5]